MVRLDEVLHAGGLSSGDGHLAEVVVLTWRGGLQPAWMSIGTRPNAAVRQSLLSMGAMVLVSAERTTVSARRAAPHSLCSMSSAGFAGSPFTFAKGFSPAQPCADGGAHSANGVGGAKERQSRSTVRYRPIARHNQSPWVTAKLPSHGLVAQRRAAPILIP